MSRRHWEKMGWPLVILVLVTSAWELTVRLLHVPRIIVPAPTEVLRALYLGFRSGVFLTHAWVTVEETLLGFAIGAALGVLAGAPIAFSPALESALNPFILALQTMPKIAIAPLLMIWVGAGLESKVIITAVVAWFPVMVNLIVGLRSVAADQVNLIRVHRGNAWDQFWLVRLPSAAPYAFAGLKTAIVLSVLGAITGEFVGSEAGLGYLLNQQMQRLDTPGVFAVLLLLSLFGVILYLLTDFLQRRVVFWVTPERFNQ